MFSHTGAFSSFSVNNLEKAKAFYEDTIGLEVQEEAGMGLRILKGDHTTVFIYPKEDHAPATFTVLNFVVNDIDKAIGILMEKGVQFINYDREDLPQDEKGVLRGKKAGRGPDIAWFEDPAGNVLSILEE